MSRDPAFLWYPGDWDGGTKLFNRYEKGAYMDLLMCQFHNGHMTKENLVFILGQPDYDLLWESKLKSKFVKDDEGKFFNQKLESEQIKRRKWCESRANNKEGKNQYSGHTTKKKRSYDLMKRGHMENVNENENKDIINNDGKFKKPTLMEVTLYCVERKNKVNPQTFIDHYESNGWMVGKVHMKNWKATVRKWENNNFEGGKNGNQKYNAATESGGGTGTPHIYQGEPKPSDDEIERNKKRIQELREKAFGKDKVKNG